MPLTHPFSILIAHDRWATRLLLDRAKGLDDASLDRVFPIGPGSVRATLFHIIDATHVWSERVHRRVADPSRCSGQSVDALITWHDAVSEVFEQAAQGDPTERLEMPRRGKLVRATRGGIVSHVVTHAMHHRAQVLNMMRQLGVEALPPSSVFEWLLETGDASME